MRVQKNQITYLTEFIQHTQHLMCHSPPYIAMKGNGEGVDEPTVTVDESVLKKDGSDDEEKGEDIENSICQLLDQRMASQCRDKSCTPSH